jgi:hypothetical protein
VIDTRWFVRISGAASVTCRRDNIWNVRSILLYRSPNVSKHEIYNTCPYTHCTRVHESELLHEHDNTTTLDDVATSVRRIRNQHHDARQYDVGGTHPYRGRGPYYKANIRKHRRVPWPYVHAADGA